MQKLHKAITLVQDPATKEALALIADELSRIRRIQPATQGVKSLSVAINQITGKL
jgi:pilus assembly protein TadC